MTNDATLKLPPPLHIGAQIELSDAVLKDYAERIVRGAREMRAEVNEMERRKAELKWLREIFRARLHEILPAAKEWNMRMASNGTNVVVSGPRGEGCDCGDGLKLLGGGGSMPAALKLAIQTALMKKMAGDE